ncbi:MAG: fused MFS/spermidine synthase [Ruminococcus sp.]|nr:fused MFS/spermidine synthase [Ruminococcus sp.]
MAKKENKASSEVKTVSSGILKHKWYLYLTEFFAGMSVMAVELGASRLLAPYFSSSQIVWTIIIGTIMIAMALGNIYGGRSADKNPNPDKLYARVLIAAVWIAAIPFFGKFVILGISALLVVTVNTNFLIWAAFITCMAVFVFPLFLLGTVTPSLVKYTVDSLDDSGKTVGTLGAFNTIGSIIGTFIPTFVSIPAVGTAATFLIFSGILLVLGLIYFIFSKRGAVRCGVTTALFLVSCVLSNLIGFAFWEKNLVFEGESIYNYLQVKETDTKTYLSTNVLFGVQSVYVKSGELSGLYYDYAMAAPLMSDCGDEEKDILILGMGTGTYAKQCMNYFDGINAEGVEIDEKITELSRRYFDLPENVKVTTYDGRAFLNVSDKKYDVIMVDAYQDITIPFQMSSKEFFSLVKAHLKENGVMVVNMNMRSDSADGINSWLADTIADVFSEVYTVDVIGSTNRELFASENPQMLEVLSENKSELENEALYDMISSVSANLVRYEGGDKILTDDKAPVELLGMNVIDDIIQEELVYYKQKFKEEGIKGLLE